MSDRDRPDQPDYGELLRSPYDPDPERPERAEGSSEISWKWPVIGAMIGALVAGAFVVYAASIRSAEGTPEATPDTTTSTVAPEPVVSTDFPDGYTGVSEDVSVRVEAVDVSSRGTVLSVTSAVRGGEEPAAVPPLEVAFWELQLADSVVEVMTAQRDQVGALGNLTIEFEPLATIRQPILVAHPATGQATAEFGVDLDAAVPQTISDLSFDLGDGNVLMIDSIDIGDGWGWIEWSIEGDIPARVDTVITFVGTDDPQTPDVEDATRLVSPHLRTLSQGSGIIPLPPLYGFTGSEQLVRDGEPLSGANAPSAIRVDITVLVPESIGEPVEIPVPPSP